MTVCGIVAEYNPFHNGHRYQIEKAKALSGADAVAVVMSGNFTQRGEPAVCDKYARTKTALLNGADIVFELPVYFATASAEYFASAAVTILEKSGVVDFLSFGSESGDLAALLKTAALLSREKESAEYQSKLKAALKKGLSFPAARQSAFGAAPVEPNDILAVEYLKALKALGSGIEPLVIRRKTAMHHAASLPEKGAFASATAIRNVILTDPAWPAALKPVLPETSLTALKTAAEKQALPNALDHFSRVFRYILASSSLETLKGILDMNEGIENRMRAFALENRLISEIVPQIKTKRYPYTKIQRAILHTILNIRITDFENFMNHGGPQYIRVLGFRKEKSALLAQLKEKAGLPVLINLKHAPKTISPLGLKMLSHEIMTTDIYNLGLKKPRKAGYEYGEPVCIM